MWVFGVQGPDMLALLQCMAPILRKLRSASWTRRFTLGRRDPRTAQKLSACMRVSHLTRVLCRASPVQHIVLTIAAPTPPQQRLLGSSVVVVQQCQDMLQGSMPHPTCAGWYHGLRPRPESSAACILQSWTCTKKTPTFCRSPILQKAPCTCGRDLCSRQQAG